jgi:phage shock protein A
VSALDPHIEAHRVHAESLRKQAMSATRAGQELLSQGALDGAATETQTAILLSRLATAHDATADALERRVRDRI